MPERRWRWSGGTGYATSWGLLVILLGTEIVQIHIRGAEFVGWGGGGIGACGPLGGSDSILNTVDEAVVQPLPVDVSALEAEPKPHSDAPRLNIANGRHDD